jgi:mono/diheme cytochrome c family protein
VPAVRRALLLLLVGACSRQVAGGQADGQRIYHELCERCHGPAGVPDPGLRAQLGVKDLTDPELHARLSDDDLRRQVREGSANKKMPGFASLLTDPQVEALVAHVRTLRR